MKRLIIFTIMCMFLMMPLMAQAQEKIEQKSDIKSISSNLIEASESKRNVPSPVLPGFPQGPSYFSDVPMTEEFMNIENLARVNAEWTRTSIESWAGRWDDVDMENVEYTERIIASYHDSSDKLKISFVNPRHQNWEFIGIIKAKAEEGSDMEAVISVLLENAINNGANILYPMNQGAKRVLSTSAFGIALGYSHVTIGGGSERNAGAGTAGIGWTSGESSYRHEPFLRVAIYKVEDDVYEKTPTFINGGDMNEVLKRKVIELQKKVQQYQKENETR